MIAVKSADSSATRSDAEALAVQPPANMLL